MKKNSIPCYFKKENPSEKNDKKFLLEKRDEKKRI
jgi:hypothetical protein